MLKLGLDRTDTVSTTLPGCDGGEIHRASVAEITHALTEVVPKRQAVLPLENDFPVRLTTVPPIEMPTDGQICSIVGMSRTLTCILP